MSFSIVCGASLGIAAALIAFGCWGEVARKVTLHGVLLPAGGLIHVAAPQAGVIAELLAREGDEVQIGQPLLRLKSERVTAAGDAVSLNAQAFAARRASLEMERRLTEQSQRQRQDSVTQRLQSLLAEERQVQGELDTHRLRIQLAQKSVERQTELARSGFVAPAQVQQRQEELLDLQLRERTAERNLQALRRDLHAAQADKLAAENQAQTILTQLDRSLAALSQESVENTARDALTVIAPQAGKVSASLLGVGQAVQTGQTLASLVPLGTTDPTSQTSAGVRPAHELQAQLFAPSRTAGFIAVGQTVWLRYAAFPYQKFGMAKGEIIAVSRSPIAPQDFPSGQSQALVAASQANEPMYRVTVRLPAQMVNTYGRQSMLSPGMSLDADIQQDTRKIWEWLLEPALAIAGSKRNLSSEAQSSPGG